MKFDCGDEAIFMETGPGDISITKTCCIVGITLVETESQVPIFGYPLGTTMYTIELGDGSDRLVPEKVLELIPTNC